MQKIIPHLWYDSQAEEAVNFYVSIFKNSKIFKVARYGESGAKISGRPSGSVMSISFQLDGQDFMAINGGPIFKFNESISLIVQCKDQKEIDYFWEKLSADPKSEQCGWLKDKYGLSWQIVPAILGDMMTDKDPAKSERIMSVFLKMKKIDIETLRQAAK